MKLPLSVMCTLKIHLFLARLGISTSEHINLSHSIPQTYTAMVNQKPEIGLNQDCFKTELITFQNNNNTYFQTLKTSNCFI